jgi:hypothetical protein
MQLLGMSAEVAEGHITDAPGCRGFDFAVEFTDKSKFPPSTLAAWRKTLE